MPSLAESILLDMPICQSLAYGRLRQYASVRAWELLGGCAGLTPGAPDSSNGSMHSSMLCPGCSSTDGVSVPHMAQRMRAGRHLSRSPASST
eukprot:2093335-Rhodomonas_salina.1